MAMSDAHRKTMLENTRPAAAALLEDLQHIRAILNRENPSAGEIRRLSVTLRRLLVNRELTIVAAPRMGRFRFQAPDIKSVYKLRGELLFFSSGARHADTAYFSPTIAMYRTSKIPRRHDIMPWTCPPALISLSLDGFLGQRVLYLHGDWVNRRDTIKYVANVASGAHSKFPQTSEDKLLASISSSVKIQRTSEKAYSVDFLGRFDLMPQIQPFRYTPDALDPVLIELVAAAAFTSRSEDTKTLETIIADELR